MQLRARPGEGEQRHAERDEREQPDLRRGGHLGGQRDVEDQQDDRHHVEHAVGEDGAHERRPQPLALRHLGNEHGDPGDLPDAAREDRVAHQPDGERGEDRPEAGPGRGSAASITCIHASERASTDSRLNAMATTTHFQETAEKASPMSPANTN